MAAPRAARRGHRRMQRMPRSTGCVPRVVLPQREGGRTETCAGTWSTPAGEETLPSRLPGSLSSVPTPKRDPNARAFVASGWFPTAPGAEDLEGDPWGVDCESSRPSRRRQAVTCAPPAFFEAQGGRGKARPRSWTDLKTASNRRRYRRHGIHVFVFLHVGGRRPWFPPSIPNQGPTWSVRHHQYNMWLVISSQVIRPGYGTGRVVDPSLPSDAPRASFGTGRGSRFPPRVGSKPEGRSTCTSGRSSPRSRGIATPLLGPVGKGGCIWWGSIPPRPDPLDLPPLG